MNSIPVFDAYSRYYDLLYQDKDYDGEVDYIDSLLRKYKTPGNDLLEFGSGTGKHGRLLIEKGYNITIIDSLITGNKKVIPKKANLEICDIGNKTKIKKILKKEKFSAVLHFAGLIRVDESVKYPKKYMEYNYKKSKVFIETCIKNGLDKIIFSSTGSVYGNVNKENILETDETKPINPYSESKLKFEKYLESFIAKIQNYKLRSKVDVMENKNIYSI